MVYMSVHKYDTNSTSELLTVMTIALLDKAGYNPTFSDLFEITGLPKANITRYMSRQVKDGFMTDVIDPQDRRRRFYRPTSKGKKEEQWHHQCTLKLAGMSSEALRGVGKNRNAASDLKNILLGINRSSVAST
jgi:DNA-binding MarR family transcriptional regulator